MTERTNRERTNLLELDLIILLELDEVSHLTTREDLEQGVCRVLLRSKIGDGA